MNALEFVKQSFEGRNRESLIFVISDREAQKLLVAWTYYGPEVRDFGVRPSDNPHIVLGRLWRSVGPIDAARLGAAAGVPETRARRIFDRLWKTCLVYPDGTVSPTAMSVVRAEVGAYVTNLVPQRKTTAPPAASVNPGGAGVPGQDSAGLSERRPPASGANPARRGAPDRHRHKAR